MGSDINQDLGGSVIKNMGPKPNGGFGNMFIGNLSPSVALAQVATGPTFNLHHMAQTPQKLSSSNANYIAYGIPGHFRDQQHLDIFSGGIIFWADDNGNYDSTNYSILSFRFPGGRPFELLGGAIDPYIAELTSDTVDDIVLSFLPEYIDGTKDTNYLALYRGGIDLVPKDTIFEDTSVVFPTKYLSTSVSLACTQADFRGVGRDDLIVSDNRNNMCYYKNAPPFSLSQFAQAVTNDTIFTSWQNPSLFTGNGFSWLNMRALPKAPGDKSVDFMPVFDTVNSNFNVSTGNIFIFRGGGRFWFA